MTPFEFYSDAEERFQQQYMEAWDAKQAAIAECDKAWERVKICQNWLDEHTAISNA